MDKKLLIVIDMQHDFVYGALGSKEAQAIVPVVKNKVKSFEGMLIFTRDTHQYDYMEHQEGKFLPVPHCIENTEGWEIIPELKEASKDKTCLIYDKPTFGCTELAQDLLAEHLQNPIGEIEIIGVCTDICVVSNALMIKAFLPDVPVSVDAACCAGVTPEAHEAALATMRSCQIMVK